MESEKRGFRLLSVSSLRTLSLACIIFVGAFFVMWLYKEQSQVQKCTQIAPAVQPRAPVVPVQVSVHLPRENNTTPPAWDYNWDKKVYTNDADKKNAPTRSIILIRHGQYNLKTGILTELGREQANITGRRLKELNMDYKVIIHSTFDRAVETADIIHKHLSSVPIHSDPLLCEGGPKPPTPTITYWSLPERDYFMDGPRLEAAFRKYFHRADPDQKKQTFDILVGHGNIFRFFALKALQLRSDAWMRFFIAHASITTLHINPDSTVSLTRLGDSGHFPPKYVTY